MHLSLTSSPVAIAIILVALFILIQTARAAYYKGRCKSRQKYINSLIDDVNHERQLHDKECERSERLEAALTNGLKACLEVINHRDSPGLDDGRATASTEHARGLTGMTEGLPDDTPTAAESAAAKPSPFFP